MTKGDLSSPYYIMIRYFMRKSDALDKSEKTVYNPSEVKKQ